MLLFDETFITKSPDEIVDTIINKKDSIKIEDLTNINKALTLNHKYYADTTTLIDCLNILLEKIESQSAKSDSLIKVMNNLNKIKDKRLSSTKSVSYEIDRYEIDSTNYLKNLKFKDFKALTFAHYNELERIRQIKELENNGKVKLSAKEFAKLLIQVFPIRYNITKLKNERVVELYFREIDSDLYSKIQLVDHVTSMPIILAKYTDVLIEALDLDLKKDIRKFELDVYHQLTLLDFKYLNVKQTKIPPTQYGMYTNGIYDFRNSEFYSNTSSKYQKLVNRYAFTHCKPRRYIHYSKLTKEHLDYVKIFKEFYLSISPDEHPDTFQFHLEDLRSTIEGNGRGIYKIQIGPGGNGKSTNDDIHKALAGAGYYAICNFNEFGDDNKLVGMDENTAITIGDDLGEFIIIPEKAIQNWKTLVAGGEISANKKYSHDVLVRNRGNFHQNVNTFPTNLIANEAFIRRIIIVPFVDLNFAVLSKTDERVAYRGRVIKAVTGNGDSLVVDQTAMEALESWVLANTKDFKTYTNPYLSKSKFNEIIHDNDYIANGLKSLTDFGYFELPVVAVNVTVDILNVLIQENTGMKTTIHSKKFSGQLSKELSKYGYVKLEKNSRLSDLDSKQFNLKVLQETFSLPTKNYINRTAIYVNESHLITDDSIKDAVSRFLEQKGDRTGLTMRDWMMLYYDFEKNYNVDLAEYLS